MVTGYLLSVSPIIIAFPSLWLFYETAIPLSWRWASSLPGAPSPLPTSPCCSRAPGGTHWGCSHTAQLLGPSPRPPQRPPPLPSVPWAGDHSPGHLVREQRVVSGKHQDQEGNWDYQVILSFEM